ncbi:MAG: CRISPR system precrRNA processing endoribonuclease RAMP protein Cas6 [Chloroflexota bacterium]|nr:CRISPR system precrRNA processing endoribonuclease RAMP protein Cas6 [Chloroflexota bacterium]
MPTAIVLTLKPTQAATVPAFLGRAAHAWFLQEIADYDTERAQSLHAPQARKPFTLSPLGTPGLRAREGRVALPAGHACYLRLTSLEPELTQQLLATFVPRWEGDTLRLAGVAFRVAQVATTPTAHPAAATCTYAELRDAAAAAPPPQQLTLQFVTPTTFRQSPPRTGRFDVAPYALPLPEPTLVFGSLARAWQQFAPRALPAEWPDFVAACVVLSRYRLHTELVTFGHGRRGKVGGFKGQCRFALRCASPEWQRRLGLLAAWAPFAGLGWRTSMGLGQVRLL